MEKITIKEKNYLTVGYCHICGSAYIVHFSDIRPYYNNRHGWTCPECKTLFFLDEYHEKIYAKFDKLNFTPPALWRSQKNCNGECKHCKDVFICYKDVLDKEGFTNRLYNKSSLLCKYLKSKTF